MAAFSSAQYLRSRRCALSPLEWDDPLFELTQGEEERGEKENEKKVEWGGRRK